MLIAKIVCSDPGCEEEHEIAVKRLIQLDGFTCECGYGYELVSVAELEEDSGKVVSIAKRLPGRGRIPGSQRRAA